MKKMNELQQGKCTVVAKCGEETNHFNGEYDEALNVVFFAIPSRYEIIGYLQN